MSDANAILLGNISTATIADVVAAAFPQADEMRINHRAGSDTSTIRITPPGSDGSRSLYVFTNNAVADDYADVYQGDATMVSLYNDVGADLVLGALLDRFGGYIRIHDDEEYFFCPARDGGAEPPSDRHRFDAALRETMRAAIAAFGKQLFPVADQEALAAALGAALRGVYPAEAPNAAASPN